MTWSSFRHPQASVQPFGASARMQTPLAAAVRAVVISPASMIARGSPVSGR
jgi:hypothetical protein